MIDTKFFGDGGIEIPPIQGWIYDDLLALAQQMTGLNPVNGEQNYGISYFDNQGSNIWKLFSSVCAAWDVQTMTLDAANKYDTTLDFTLESI